MKASHRCDPWHAALLGKAAAATAAPDTSSACAGVALAAGAAAARVGPHTAGAAPVTG